MARLASRSITKEVSTSLPSILPARAALASPGPIAEATSATVTGASKCLTAPSGSRTSGMVRVPLGNRANPIAKKSADEPHFFRIFRGTAACELGDRQSVSKRVRGVITMSFLNNNERSQASVKGGRRDWTRTNDPHHVKVVL